MNDRIILNSTFIHMFSGSSGRPVRRPAVLVPSA